MADSRPKRTIKKRVVIDFNDFMKSSNEERELARAIRESLKSTTNPAVLVKSAPAEPVASTSNSPAAPETNSEPAVRARPKRCIKIGNQQVFEYSHSQTKAREERDVARAIQESLKLANGAPAVSTDLSSSHTDPLGSDAADLPTAVKVSRLNSSKPQRKFAQNATQQNGSSAVNGTTTTRSGAGKTVAVCSMTKVFPEIIPNTEDFISFLCLRKAPVLSQEIDIPELNRKAALERRDKKYQYVKVKEKQRKDPLVAAAVTSVDAADVTNGSDGSGASAGHSNHVSSSPQRKPNFDAKGEEAVTETYLAEDAKREKDEKKKKKIRNKQSDPNKITNKQIPGKSAGTFVTKSAAKLPVKSSLKSAKPEESVAKLHLAVDKRSAAGASPKKRLKNETIAGKSVVKKISKSSAANDKQADEKADAEEKAMKQRKIIEKRKEIIKSFASNSRNNLSSSSSSSSSADSDSSDSSSSSTEPSSRSPLSPKSRSKNKSVDSRVTRSMQMPSPSASASQFKSPSAMSSGSRACSPIKRASGPSKGTIEPSIRAIRVLRRVAKNLPSASSSAVSGIRKVVEISSHKKNRKMAMEEDCRRVTRTKQCPGFAIK